MKNNQEYINKLESENKLLNQLIKDNELLNYKNENFKIAEKIAHVGSFEIDHITKDIFWSDEIYNIVGTKKTDYKPKLSLFIEFLDDYEKQGIIKKYNESIKNKTPFNLIYKIINQENFKKRYIDVKAIHKLDQNGDLLKTIGTIQDITELETLRRMMAQRVGEEITKREEKDKLLIQQSKMATMGEMIGSIAHQWRQPLNALSLEIQDIQDAFKFEELDEAYLNRSRDKCMKIIKYMSETINVFKDFFQPNKYKDFFSIKQSLFIVIDILNSQLIHAKIDINVEGDDFKVYGFSNEFKQVIINIINNAKDAIISNIESNKIKKGKISINLNSDEQTNYLTIEDNGGGINEKFLEKIYDPYFSTKIESNGTGIGLYMSKSIIEKSLSGKLIAENITLNNEKGVRFKMIFKRSLND